MSCEYRVASTREKYNRSQHIGRRVAFAVHGRYTQAIALVQTMTFRHRAIELNAHRVIDGCLLISFRFLVHPAAPLPAASGHLSDNAFTR